MGQPIDITDVAYTYRHQSQPRPAVDGVTLTVSVGELVCIMGPSGSGKSTLIRLIAGLQKPGRGTIKIGATEISGATPDTAAIFRRRHVGLVFQFFDLIPDFSLRQNVALQLLMDGKRMADVRDHVDSLLVQLGLQDRMDHTLDELSGGELQRVAIARALAADPAIVLADEPTANLEERTSDEVIQILTTMCHARGVTTIIATHNPEFRAVADRVLQMRDGKIYGSAQAAEP